MDGWSDFNVAMAGASAALAGLVIVAASVNIDKIIRAGTLTARLGAAIASLVLALVASAVGLIPEIDPIWYGVVLTASAIGAGIFQLHAARVIVSDPEPAQRARTAKAVLGFLPIAAYLAAGIALIAGSDGGLVLARRMPARDRLGDRGVVGRAGRSAAVRLRPREARSASTGSATGA